MLPSPSHSVAAYCRSLAENMREDGTFDEMTEKIRAIVQDGDSLDILTTNQQCIFAGIGFAAFLEATTESIAT